MPCHAAAWELEQIGAAVALTAGQCECCPGITSVPAASEACRAGLALGGLLSIRLSTRINQKMFLGLRLVEGWGRESDGNRICACA